MLTLLVLVMGLFLIFAIIYNLYILSKIPLINLNVTASRSQPAQENSRPDNSDYKKIIEQSKYEYKTLMDKVEAENPKLNKF